MRPSLGWTLIAVACSGGESEIPPKSTECPKQPPSTSVGGYGQDVGPCDLVDGTLCAWGVGEDCPAGTTGGYASVSFKCSGGRWRFEVGEGAPCRPGCPTSAPVPSSPCSTYESCAYEDLCRVGLTDHYSCIADRWSVTTGTYANPCPTDAPRAGDACRCLLHLPPSCTWGGVIGTCSPATRTWILTTSDDAGVDATDAD